MNHTFKNCHLSSKNVILSESHFDSMKTNIVVALTCICLFLISWDGNAQNETVEILKSPTDWKFEKIDFPPDFAADLAYQGFEELRFAPGMFDPSSESYFTYSFAVSLDGISKFQQSDMMGFLYKYFKGLCKSVAESKNMEVDVSKIFVTIRMYDTSSKNRQDYKAQVVYFDTFNEGQEVKLNLDLQVFRQKKCNKINIMALASPKLFNDETWKELYETRDTNTFPSCN